MLKSTRLLLLSKHLKLTVSVIPNSHPAAISLQQRTLTAFHVERSAKHLNKFGCRNIFDKIRNFRRDPGKEDEESTQKAVMLYSDFEKSDKKDKKTFLQLLKIYDGALKNKRGHVDFIRAALRQMKAFGVHEDLEAYKRLIDVLPKGIYVATNFMMVEGMFYPRQQFVALDLLEQMELNRVTPDAELCEILISIFGKKAYPSVKVQNMLYWTVKMQNKSPWVLPKKMPVSPHLLGKMAVERITSVDLQTEISVFETKEVPESHDNTWIVSGQSPKQRQLLENHPPDVPVIVEGGDVVWLEKKYVTYFMLKKDVLQPRPYNPGKDIDDISDLESEFFNPNIILDSTDEDPSVHEQDDAVIYAVCVTGTSSKDSLLSWVRLLQQNGNPVLQDLPVLFRFINEEKSPVITSDELVQQQ